MNNDQRLIPFLGGLVIGGAAGSQTGRYPINNQYPAYYQQPYYGTPYYAYPNQYAQQVPFDFSQFPGYGLNNQYPCLFPYNQV